jgi:hypothetical protein
MTFAADGRGKAMENSGAQARPVVSAAKRSSPPAKLRAPQEMTGRHAQNMPFTSPPQGLGDALSFVPVPNDARYAVVPFTPNPLVSSPYKATPEYQYLYTAAQISRSPPPLKIYSYRADNSYLVRPIPAYQETAWSYQWKRPPSHRTAIRAVRSLAPVDEPAATRRPGQKIESSLKAGAVAPREGNGVWRPSAGIGDLELGEIIQLPARPY